MISVIVPVYNAADRLARCIESIQAQTYEDWELILIDDGSKDDSFSVCERYAAADQRIRPFTQPNRGVSATRNRGIASARGRYLQFVDSDDYLRPDMMTQMLHAMEQSGADMVICGRTEVCGGTEQIIVPKLAGSVEVSELSTAYPDIFATPLINAIWTKLYKRDTVTGSFPEDLSMGEDLLFNLDVLRRCRRVCFLQEPFYIYEKTEGSLSTRERQDTAEIAEKLYVACMEFAGEYGFGPRAEQDLSTVFVQFFCYGISSNYRNPKLSPDQKKDLLRSWADNPNLRRALAAAQMPQLKQRVVQQLMKHKLLFLLHPMLQAKS